MGVEPPEHSHPGPNGKGQVGREVQEFWVDTDRTRLRLQHNVAIAVLGGVFLGLVWGGVFVVWSVARHLSVVVLVVALCAATAALTVAVVRGRRRLRPFFRLHGPLVSIDDIGIGIAGSPRLPWSQILEYYWSSTAPHSTHRAPRRLSSTGRTSWPARAGAGFSWASMTCRATWTNGIDP